MSREFNEKVDKMAEAAFPTAVPFSTPDEKDPDQFLNKAKQLVFDEIPLDNESGLEIYVVWFAKTLQNWKALLSTNIPDGKYYEVTYNGDKQEAYVDTYVKILNTRRPDAVSVPHTQEENIQFRKDWDKRVDEGNQTPDLVGRD